MLPSTFHHSSLSTSKKGNLELPGFLVVPTQGIVALRHLVKYFLGISSNPIIPVKYSIERYTTIDDPHLKEKDDFCSYSDSSESGEEGDSNRHEGEDGKIPAFKIHQQSLETPSGATVKTTPTAQAVKDYLDYTKQEELEDVEKVMFTLGFAATNVHLHEEQKILNMKDYIVSSARTEAYAP